jgi:hypothetical protein
VRKRKISTRTLGRNTGLWLTQADRIKELGKKTLPVLQNDNLPSKESKALINVSPDLSVRRNKGVNEASNEAFNESLAYLRDENRRPLQSYAIVAESIAKTVLDQDTEDRLRVKEREQFEKDFLSNKDFFSLVKDVNENRFLHQEALSKIAEEATKLSQQNIVPQSQEKRPLIEWVGEQIQSFKTWITTAVAV